MERTQNFAIGTTALENHGIIIVLIVIVIIENNFIIIVIITTTTQGVWQCQGCGSPSSRPDAPTRVRFRGSLLPCTVVLFRKLRITKLQRGPEEQDGHGGDTTEAAVSSQQTAVAARPCAGRGRQV